MLITLSGLDGAGKTTLIGRLTPALEQQGHTVTLLTMYDHVGVYATVRALLKHLGLAPTATDTGQPSEDVSSNRKDWTLKRLSRSAIIKRVILPFDVVIFSLMRLYLECFRGKTVVLDRYFYDSIADVTVGASWTTVRAFLALVPAANLSIFIDVSPQQAYDRKGEYPVDYMELRRKQYQQVFGNVANSLTLANDDLEATAQALIEAVNLKAQKPTPST